MKLGEIASRLRCELIGDPHTEISGLSAVEDAHPGELTFLSNPKYKKHLKHTQASAIILDHPSLLPPGKSGLISPTPYLAFAEAATLFLPHHPETHRTGIHPQSSISPSAHIGRGVSIGPFTVVGDNVRIGNNVIILSHCTLYPDVIIGDDSFLHSHCVIREGAQIGNQVIIQNSVVIGSDGFGYAKRPDKTWQKIPQMGRVLIEDNVEIGAGTVIDRATLGTTIIRKGAKIDNLVQIGHGSVVGENSLLCAQVGLAGSTKVGQEVILSGQVGAAGHLTIGDRSIATAQTGIPNSIEADKIVSGYPAIDNRTWLKASALFAQLPRLNQEIRRLKAKLEDLERKMDSIQERQSP
jgi:UDP-3-O-[3-hydroxymyristoyl] glucosamine N-acyltransferase